MTFRSYLLLMLAGTLMAWGTWGVIVWSQDPTVAPVWVILCFYASFFLGFLGLVSTVSLLTRVLILKRPVPLFKEVVQSFRQGVLFSALMVTGLSLQHRGWLTWWNALLLILFATTIEFFIISTRIHRTRGIL